MLGERSSRLITLALGTTVFFLSLWCLAEFLNGLGLWPLALLLRAIALFFLGVAPIAGVWDYQSRGQ